MLQRHIAQHRRQRKNASNSRRRCIGEYYDAKQLRFEQLEQRWLLVADPVAGDDSFATNEDAIVAVAPSGNYAANVLADSSV